MDGSGAAPVRERTQTRRVGAWVPQLQRGSEYLQGLCIAQRAEDPVRIDVRQHLQPHDVLRSGHELEFEHLRHDQYAVQSGALDSVRVEIRFLMAYGDPIR